MNLRIPAALWGRISLSILPLLTLCGLLSACDPAVEAEYEPRTGDVVFQILPSPQSRAVQIATHSPWSHTGIVFVRDGAPFVYEAVGPVRMTPLAAWRAQGAPGRFAARRLTDAGDLLTSTALARMEEVGKTFQGKPYDFGFEWSDDRIYCSELVWKIYDRALGVEVGALQKMRDFDLSNPIVAAQVEERWGGPPPPGETVVSPAAIFVSERLTTVFEEGAQAAEQE